MMNENQKKENGDLVEEEENIEDDDLKAYLEEMKVLESDFSDLEDLDMEELQEIQDAISKVKDNEIDIEQISLANKDFLSLLPTGESYMPPLMKASIGYSLNKQR